MSLDLGTLTLNAGSCPSPHVETYLVLMSFCVARIPGWERPCSGQKAFARTRMGQMGLLWQSCGYQWELQEFDDIHVDVY